MRYPAEGEKMPITKCIAKLGFRTRFGEDWPGKRCLAKTRKGTLCQRPAYKHNGKCRLHGGLATGAKTSDGLQRISAANLKHGRYTKEKIEAQKKSAAVGRKVKGVLKKLELQLIKSGLISQDNRSL